MNDLSGTGVATSSRRLCAPVPASVPFVLFLLLLPATVVSLFIFVVVGNALFLAALLLLSALIVSLLLWNTLSFRRNLAVLHFVDRLRVSDLLTASHGQLVKITGLAECGDIPLESSYEKVERCVYTSTLLYEYSGFGFNISMKDYHTGSRIVSADDRYFCWKLAYLERFTADFYITDSRSGIRAVVKAGSDSKVIPLVTETSIVHTKKKNRVISSTLQKWLEERSLPVEPRLLHLKEGFIREGTSLSVVGMLSKKNGIFMIVPPPEAISTCCLFQKLLLPVDIDGLILKFGNEN
ncbi:uncharacterized membrane protein At1g16860-like [Phalaenopsis equestris]|uniref:uncharacterized membrane protein At1g16860-like n=1 Tax=Phalaenopsis equestris TaxID=78828 RepID=UPI0009E4728E|nr:uncharacterized membrane protein At1g16860-like [Phalaenopsis equestris]